MPGWLHHFLYLVGARLVGLANLARHNPGFDVGLFCIVTGTVGFIVASRKPARHRDDEAVTVLREQMRHRAVENDDEPDTTPEPEPEAGDEPATEPVDHRGADADWSPIGEMLAIGPGVLNRAALEEPTMAFVPVVPTDTQVETAMWGARWRSTDQKLETERRRITAWMATLDPELADIMRAIDLRDLELHETAAAEALAALDEPSGEHRTVLDMQRVTAGAR